MPYQIFGNTFCDGRVARTRPAAHDPKNSWVNILQLHRVFGHRVCVYVCGLATIENANRSNLSVPARMLLLNKITDFFSGENYFCRDNIDSRKQKEDNFTSRSFPF